MIRVSSFSTPGRHSPIPVVDLYDPCNYTSRQNTNYRLTQTIIDKQRGKGGEGIDSIRFDYRKGVVFGVSDLKSYET